MDYITKNWRSLAGDAESIQELQGSASEEKCTKWVYDTSEFIDTAVTDNDWVCDKVSSSPESGPSGPVSVFTS